VQPSPGRRPPPCSPSVAERPRIRSEGSLRAGQGITVGQDKVVRAEDLAIRAGADTVHGAGLEVHEHSARDKAAT
jgi:hypothetical protein